MNLSAPRFGFLIASLVLLADQLTKWWMIGLVFKASSTSSATPTAMAESATLKAGQ